MTNFFATYSETPCQKTGKYLQLNKSIRQDDTMTLPEIRQSVERMDRTQRYLSRRLNKLTIQRVEVSPEMDNKGLYQSAINRFRSSKDQLEGELKMKYKRYIKNCKGIMKKRQL